MAHQLFSETDDWELENDDQDIRGYSVVDEQGQTLGTVRDMYVDTDTETIDRLVLDNGQEIDVASASVEDGVIRVGGLGGTTAGYDTTTTDYGTTDTAEVTTATAAAFRAVPASGSPSGIFTNARLSFSPSDGTATSNASPTNCGKPLA